MPCNLPSLPPKRDAEGLPVTFDLECDREIPKRVFSAWKEDRKAREIVRELSVSEHEILAVRATALEQALEPYRPVENEQVRACIAAMFSGFRSMRQVGEEMSATVEITSNVSRSLPAWAIAKACMMIARGQTDLDNRFAPNDTEIFAVVEGIVRPYREALQRAHALLSAPVETRPSGSNQYRQNSKPIQLSSNGPGDSRRKIRASRHGL
jgi:hypothetical protein